MTIKEYIESPITDDMEQIVILSGTVDNVHREYTGKLYEVPTMLKAKEIEWVTAMGEERRSHYHLNQYGWTEIWLVEEE